MRALYVMSADGSGTLTFLGAVSSYLGTIRRVRIGQAAEPDWSPAGGRIAFTEVTFGADTLNARIWA